MRTYQKFSNALAVRNSYLDKNIQPVKSLDYLNKISRVILEGRRHDFYRNRTRNKYELFKI